MEISFIRTQIWFIYMWIKLIFHMKGFVLGLCLKQRRKTTLKSPIAIRYFSLGPRLRPFLLLFSLVFFLPTACTMQRASERSLSLLYSASYIVPLCCHPVLTLSPKPFSHAFLWSSWFGFKPIEFIIESLNRASFAYLSSRFLTSKASEWADISPETGQIWQILISLSSVDSNLYLVNFNDIYSNKFLSGAPFWRSHSFT